MEEGGERVGKRLDGEAAGQEEVGLAEFRSSQPNTELSDSPPAQDLLQNQVISYPGGSGQKSPSPEEAEAAAWSDAMAAILHNASSGLSCQ